jgi:hypothetical protein
MKMSASIPCITCVHFRPEVRDRDSCAAFPDQIPLEIVSGQHSHKEAFEGDNNIQWRPVPGFEYADVPDVIQELRVPELIMSEEDEASMKT